MAFWKHIVESTVLFIPINFNFTPYYLSIHREKGKYKTTELNRLIPNFPFGLILPLELPQFQTALQQTHTNLTLKRCKMKHLYFVLSPGALRTEKHLISEFQETAFFFSTPFFSFSLCKTVRTRDALSLCGEVHNSKTWTTKKVLKFRLEE